ncbi:hypothetical protein J3E64_003773 [Sphingobium sp. OAS761]|uniref:hypothetical protein n=1 Tax=Sphingobium sp. OAS761 TaxID=2817901 RepID=UPI0020A07B0B|nr:hypothetical protein [Sphingobium sp. OAS761]MCP1472058.1 hypothetical protein [Sphingobium sp. OAS761]
MGLIGWILSFAGLFAGLALRQDLPMGGSVMLSNLLIALAVLACPMLWRDKPMGISRGQRIVTALILLCATPLLLLPAA